MYKVTSRLVAALEAGTEIDTFNSMIKSVEASKNK